MPLAKGCPAKVLPCLHAIMACMLSYLPDNDGQINPDQLCLTTKSSFWMDQARPQQTVWLSQVCACDADCASHHELPAAVQPNLE